MSAPDMWPRDPVAETRELLADATPGPWEIIGGGEYITPVGIMVAPDDGGVWGVDAELIAAAPRLLAALADEVERLRENPRDEHHTMAELYDYRLAYNAAAFNEWATRGDYDVHKSLRHSDGGLCFGGGWFVVVAQLPTGQITNHYHLEHWDLFHVPERDQAAPYDGHTPAEALVRLLAFLGSPR